MTKDQENRPEKQSANLGRNERNKEHSKEKCKQHRKSKDENYKQRNSSDDVYTEHSMQDQ